MLKKERIINELNSKGFVVIKNFYSDKKCNLIKNKLNKILNSRIKKKKYIGKKNAIVLYNYFIDDKSLIDTVYNRRLDNILTKLIEKNYGLTSSSARNKVLFPLDYKKEGASGNKWHRDNRYIRGQSVKPSLSYFVITAIEDFKKNNGCTLYIPGSHKTHYKIKKNQKVKKFKFLEAKKGSLIILDTNLAHKAGKPSNISRWSIFNMYSPWFIKPYYEYYKIKKIPNFGKNIKKILHYNYIPPTDYNMNRNTISDYNKKKI